MIVVFGGCGSRDGWFMLEGLEGLFGTLIFLSGLFDLNCQVFFGLFYLAKLHDDLLPIKATSMKRESTTAHIYH